MVTVYIPTMLQSVSGGVKQVTIEASNVRQIVDELDRLYPGMKERLVDGGQIRSNVAVSIDGEIGRMGLIEKVSQDSEVHFVPAIGGGAMNPLKRTGYTD
jgi:molybdopterin synthase sulfur carrier subunit